jgi:hypothetical protein
VDRGSDKHSPMVDDQLKHETEGLVRGGRDSHAEEWKQPEPSGDDQPDSDRMPNGSLVGGTPDGMSGDDVEGRSELASYVGKEVYPAVREQLIGAAMDNNAPPRLVDAIRRLPSGRTFANANEVWSQLGGGTEQHRF